MRFSVLIFPILAVQATVMVRSVPQEGMKRTCGTPPPSAEVLDLYQEMSLQPRHTPTESIAVDTYFHVVISPYKKSWVSSGMLTKQLRAMNKAYLPHNITFRLRNVDYTTNRDWARGYNVTARMKKLRKGGYRDLNIYFLTSWETDLGACNVPVVCEKGSDRFYQDGCNIHAGTLPGGWLGDQYNHGMTTVHEVGHWFGLFHPFQPSGPGNLWNGPGVCNGTGDYINDTPMQKYSTHGCPKQKDSCPDQPGQDSIHNYMDYSDDTCYTHFTPDQEGRMYRIWDKFRAGK